LCDRATVALAIAGPDHLLNDHRHLLVAARLSCPGGVALGPPEVGRGPDQLHRLDQLGESGVGIGLVVGGHLGGIDPGEGTIEGVLEQARGPYRQRRLDPLDQGAEIADELRRQIGLQEGSRDSLVLDIGQRQVQEVVAAQETVKDLGREHHQPRDRDLDPEHRLGVELLGQDIGDADQAMGLATELAVTDAAERRPGLVEGPVEPRHLPSAGAR